MGNECRAKHILTKEPDNALLPSALQNNDRTDFGDF